MFWLIILTFEWGVNLTPATRCPPASLGRMTHPTPYIGEADQDDAAPLGADRVSLPRTGRGWRRSSR